MSCPSLGINTSKTTLLHAVSQPSNPFLRESIPLFLQVTPQTRKGIVLIDASPHCSAYLIPEMLIRVEVWRAGWPLHHLDLLLHHELPDHSCLVGMGIVVLEHCISSRVSYIGDNYWDKTYIDVAICIQVSIENCQWCFHCVSDLSPHHDATSVERSGWLQAPSCMSLTPATPTWVRPSLLNNQNLASSKTITCPNQAQVKRTCSRHPLSRGWAVIVIYFRNPAWSSGMEACTM